MKSILPGGGADRPGVWYYKYILILKDDFSGYIFLPPSKKADAETYGQCFE